MPELPDGWDTVAYEAENYSVNTQNGALVIASAAENDVRVCQMVQVEPNTVYRLSAEISAEGVHGGRGVCLSVDNYTLDGAYAVSAGRTGSFDWTRETLIVRTAQSRAISISPSGSVLTVRHPPVRRGSVQRSLSKPTTRRR